MSPVDTEVLAVDHVIKALRQQAKPGPASLTAIRRLLPKPIRPTESVLLNVIHEGIRNGQIWESFSKGETPYYWVESPAERARSVVVALLQTKDQTAAALKKKLVAKEFQTVSPDAVLAQLVAEGQIHRRGASFSAHPIDVQQVTDQAWRLVERKLSSGDATESSLKTLLNKPLSGVLEPDEFLRALLAEGKIHRLPKSGRTIRYSLKPVDYGPHFAAPVKEFLLKLRKLAQKLELSDEKAFALAQAQLREQVGEESTPPTAAPPETPTYAAAPTAPASSPVPIGQRDGVDQLGQHIILAMHNLNPRVADGDLVSIPELRQRLAASVADKRQFDQALLELYRSRQVVLSRISEAWIADRDRDQYVVDEDGVYYNTVALWKE